MVIDEQTHVHVVTAVADSKDAEAVTKLHDVARN